VKKVVFSVSVLIFFALLAGRYYMFRMSDNLFGESSNVRCSVSKMASLISSASSAVEVDDEFCDDGWASSEVYRVYVVSIVNDEREKTQILMQWVGKPKSDIPLAKETASGVIEISAPRKLVKEIGKENINGLKIEYNLMD